MGLHNVLLIALVLALTGCLASPAPTPTTPATQPRPQKTYTRVARMERLDISIAGALLVKPDQYLGS